jgi:hypothetical protein
MVMVSFSLREDYWDTFKLQDEDVEFLYNHLLEIETPLTSSELVGILVAERIRREKTELERQRSSGGDTYKPKEHFTVNQALVFPALGWINGKVQAVRPGQNTEIGVFEVIKVQFDNGEEREYAAGLQDHILNLPPQIVEDVESLNSGVVMEQYGETLVECLEEGLSPNVEFVRIAGRWFPRALLIDINIGHLNLAEAVLDMAGGGPLPTSALLDQLGLPKDVNPKLLEFSLDLALQEDGRFDEVGPAGVVLWYLQRLEPEPVREPPLYLRFSGVDYDRTLLTREMLALERVLDDELSPIESGSPRADEVDLHLIYPHWRAGTLPLSARLRNLFPTAYESPRIRFTLVDGDNGEKFPAWVVRPKRYVYGLAEWYRAKNLFPGAIVHVRRGERPGEVIIKADSRRPNREWLRTVLVGSDGGIVYALLKQMVACSYDERMAIAISDVEAIDQVWARMAKEHQPFEKTVVNLMRELAKLNPQSHVHVSELYSAVNVIRRCPPGPIMSLLASRPSFAHVGDLHYRFTDAETT